MESDGCSTAVVAERLVNGKWQWGGGNSVLCGRTLVMGGCGSKQGGEGLGVINWNIAAINRNPWVSSTIAMATKQPHRTCVGPCAGLQGAPCCRARVVAVPAQNQKSLCNELF